MPPTDNTDQTHSSDNPQFQNVTPAFMAAGSMPDSGATPPPSANVVASSDNNKPNVNKKIVGAIAGVLVLVLGMITSLVLVQRQQRVSTQAWECAKYTFNVSQSGEVTVSLASDYSKSSESSQSAVVTINGQVKATLNVPQISKGQTLSIGRVDVPAAQGFSWEVQGQSDCKNTGVYPPQVACPPYEVKPNSGNWNMTDKFTYTNKSSSPVTVDWKVVCQYDKDPENCKKYAPADQAGTETIQPGQSVVRGFGAICATWQLDLKSTNPNCPQTGYVVERQNCSVTTTPTKTPTPKPSTTPTRTPTPRPSTTPANTPTKTPTPKPSTTPTRTPTPTRVPTTPPGQPTNTPAPTHTPSPTNPAATNTTTPTTPPTANNPTSTPKPVATATLPESGAVEYTLIAIVAGLLFLGFGSTLAFRKS